MSREGHSPRDGDYQRYCTSHWEDDRPWDGYQPRDGCSLRDNASSKNASDGGGFRLDPIVYGLSDLSEVHRIWDRQTDKQTDTTVDRVALQLKIV